MGLLVSVVAGLIVWIVLWSIGAKGFDAFMITTAIALIGVTARMLTQFLVPKRRS